MIVLSAGLLVSKCHEAIVYADDDGNNRCSTCLAVCETAGTLGELWERKEHERKVKE